MHLERGSKGSGSVRKEASLGVRKHMSKHTKPHTLNTCSLFYKPHGRHSSRPTGTYQVLFRLHCEARLPATKAGMAACWAAASSVCCSVTCLRSQTATAKPGFESTCLRSRFLSLGEPPPQHGTSEWSGCRHARNTNSHGSQPAGHALSPERSFLKVLPVPGAQQNIWTEGATQKAGPWAFPHPTAALQNPFKSMNIEKENVCHLQKLTPHVSRI